MKSNVDACKDETPLPKVRNEICQGAKVGISTSNVARLFFTCRWLLCTVNCKLSLVPMKTNTTDPLACSIFAQEVHSSNVARCASLERWRRTRGKRSGGV